jgi:membrane-associated phospholipid phosphatase
MEDYLFALHSQEIEWILWLQGFVWLELPMLFFTFLGSQAFFLLVLPAVYWSVDTKRGYQFGVLLLISASLNSILKLVFHLPRPYWVDTRVRAYLPEETFGLPSGHAQIGLAVFGLLGVFLRTRIAWAAVLSLVFLIGLSRIFLGVHFPSDVLTGWWIGAMVLFGFLALAVNRRGINERSTRLQALRYLALGLLLLLAGWLTLDILDRVGWMVPEIWIENARIAFPDLEPIDPLRLEEIAIASGAFFGFAAGGYWLQRRTEYSSLGSNFQRILRYIIGMAGVAVVYLLTEPFLSEGASTRLAILQFVQFTLIGVWISAVAPGLFMRLNLAGQSASPRDETIPGG